MQLDRPVSIACSELDRAGPVAERVVDEIRERLAEASRVAQECEPIGAFHLDRPTLVGCAALEAAGRARQELAGVELLVPDREPSLVRARHEQQVLGELDEPVGLHRCRPESLLELARTARLSQCELELGLEERERRSELVTRVRCEAPLALEACVEALEHLVERLPQSMHLVVRSRQRKSSRRGRRRDLAGAAPHRLHRPKRSSGDEVADAG